MVTRDIATHHTLPASAAASSRARFRAAMKICGACGLELDKSCFSKKQWQLSKQKRRCKECVDKRTPPGERKATQWGTDDESETEPLPPVEIPTFLDGAGSAGEAEADDVGCTNIKSSKEEADNDEICSICLDMYVDPVQLSCGHSFCEVCLDGWHQNSKYDVHQPRNCPVCRHKTKPSREIISLLYYYFSMVKTAEAKGEDLDMRSLVELHKIYSSLNEMGHTQRMRLTPCY